MKRRNLFSLSHYKLLTGKMGYLYPAASLEVLPGDTFQMATSIFLRFSPLVSPVMTPVTVKVHHWYVPLRLIWDDSEDFITGGADGTSIPIPPFIRATSNQVGSLSDYLGVPTFDSGTLDFSVLYHRAYNLIWNEWYRDQNLQDEVPISTESGQDTTTSTELLRSAWDKDYFTTALPYEQKGVAVNVPISLTGGGDPIITASTSLAGVGIAGNGSPTFSLVGGAASGGQLGRTSSNNVLYNTSGTEDHLQWNNPALRLTGNPTTTINWNGGEDTTGALNLNAFREAMALQRFEEHRMLYGSRYTEYLRYLGVRASDARLQRPEYLGGGRSVVQFSEVLQTSEGTDPVGTLRGHGIGAMRTNRFRRFFEEHGIVLTLVSIRPKSIYTQGLPRKFSRQIKTDYWQKELEHIGQQEVLNKEVYASGSNPDGSFGFQDRYNEYRSEWSSVHGQFRDLYKDWHLGREFAAQPVLNSDFISSLPTDRVFADQTGNDTILMMVNNSVKARRLVSKRGNPR